MFDRIQWHSPQLFWLAMLLLAGTLIAVVWLYRPQVKLLQGPWWWMLLALRATTLCALALVILRPAILRPLAPGDRDAVAVLVDLSRSMSVVDGSRSPAQLVSLAAALGAVPADLRSKPLYNLRQHIIELRRSIDEVDRACSELEYAKLAGREIATPGSHLRLSRQSTHAKLRAVMLEAAAYPATAPLAAALRQVDHLARDPADAWAHAASDLTAAVLAQADAIQAGADEQLYRSNFLVRAACDSINSQSRLQLVCRALEGDSGLIARLREARLPVRLYGFSGPFSLKQISLNHLDPQGNSSDIAGALQDLGQQLPQQRIAAAVLLTDGRQVGGESATLAGNADIPLIAVSVAAPTIKDVAIDRVVLPDAALLGQTINVGVDLRGYGFDRVTAQVSLDGAGQHLVQQVPITDGAAHAQLALKLNRAGPQDLLISVTPLPGEATILNNNVHRAIKVISEKSRVALLGGIATWDYQCLRQALGRFDALEAQDQLVDPNHAAPFSLQLLRQDVIILSDLRADVLDSSQWDAIRRVVAEQGGTAIIIVNDPALARTYASVPLVSTFWPWANDSTGPAMHVWPGEDAIYRVVPAAPDVADVLRLADDAQLSRSRWKDLPPVFRFLPLPLSMPDTRPLLVERESGLPVLTETRVGTGRILLLGLGETWRWRRFLGNDDPDRFWRQLLRYTAPQPYAVNDGQLFLDVDHLRAEPGQAIHVRARVRSPMSDPTEDEQNQFQPRSLQIYRDGNWFRTEPLTFSSGQADRTEATVQDLTAGNYEFRLLAGDRWLSLPLTVAKNDEAEMRDMTADPASLNRLVGPRGQVINLDELPSVPQRLETARQDTPAYTELRLWDSPYLFLFVLACLGVEWALRKRVGLI